MEQELSRIAGILLLVGLIFFVSRLLARNGARTMDLPASVQALTDNASVDTFAAGPEPVWLFKHSTACATSSWAWSHFRDYIDEHPSQRAAIIVVQSQRELSNYVAEKFGVRHETPQLFLLQAGKILWHDSHGGISVGEMKRAYPSI